MRRSLVPGRSTGSNLIPESRIGVCHGTADPLDDGLIRIGEQDARVSVNSGLGHLRRDVSERENAFGRRRKTDG